MTHKNVVIEHSGNDHSQALKKKILSGFQCNCNLINHEVHILMASVSIIPIKLTESLLELTSSRLIRSTVPMCGRPPTCLLTKDTVDLSFKEAVVAVVPQTLYYTVFILVNKIHFALFAIFVFSPHVPGPPLWGTVRWPPAYSSAFLSPSLSSPLWSSHSPVRIQVLFKRGKPTLFGTLYRDG